MNDEMQAELTIVPSVPVVPLARELDAGPALADEQLAYARLLDVGMKIGLLLVVVTFALYVLGVVTPHLAVTDLPRYWGLPVKKYLAATGIHAGWGWLYMLGKGDFLNFTGIAFLSSVTIACYVAIAPMFFRKGERVYGWLSVVEVLVLALAASGLLGSGAH